MLAVPPLRELLLVDGCLDSSKAQGKRAQLQLARVGAGLASVCQRDT